ncbi:beta-1,4 N-acetylgalactosaminyltransferase 2 isoform X4 [Vulpes lagopus]|uniref:beta-1,4 N-acetylgalactosaminyltransferase 2 isoform X4 n=1 Tax=Vulpes lagopus TaxID=494514 RepID=UPI001BCA3E23|nr:beta-1,4 N-acetylgalactosaminyltransferase 2 isoform X4 [Vulpes lagopus]
MSLTASQHVETSPMRSEILWLLKISVLVLGLGTVVFLFRSVEFNSIMPELPHSALNDQTLKLLPEEHLKNLFTYDGIWLFPKNQCKCEATKQKRSYNFQDAYGHSELPAVKARRQAEFEHFQRREGLPRPPPLLAQPNLPFGYPIHGVEVMPLHTVPIPERKLRDLVTIATKTFLRPHKLMTLLRSIRMYYPDLTVIIADDSKEPLKITDNHVEYYTMPFGKGWFAGRNLAISQVTTKYILWVDDDFLFNNKTKIEVLVDVLEKTELDVVGGSVLGNVFQFKLLLEKSQNGDCLHRRPGFFRPLDDFPNCVVTSGVVNFFLAHTERLQRVGFDPRLQRVAHSEFFIDGLGSLLVGSCPEVVIGHQVRSPMADPELAILEKTYSAFRTNTNDQVQFKLALHYFKNHLQCST